MPRVSTQESTTRTSSFESRTQKSGANSPASGPERPAHKRTLSGNPRTNSMRSTEERERRTEKHIVTTRETLTSRVKSPERRHVPSMSVPNEKFRATDGRRSAETRSKEPREMPPARECLLLLLKMSACAGSRQLLTPHCDSSLGPGSDAYTTHFCATGVSNINTTPCFTSAYLSTAETAVRFVTRGARGCHIRRSSLCLHGL